MHLVRLIAAGASLVLAVAGSATAQSTPPPGPCEQPGAIAALVDRPGLGRPVATNGSPCVVPRGHALLEGGYRNQQTDGANATSRLEEFPLALLRVGIDGRDEIVVLPPSQANRYGATLGGTFVALSGTQDAGFGVKRMLDDRASFQDAAELFFTAPTGTSFGAAGFSAGAPTATLTYTAGFALTGRLGASITQNFIQGAAPPAPSGSQSFFSYQPSLTVSYALTPVLSLIASDQLALPLAPGSGTGNRGLVAVQRTISPGVVVDFEFEINALPLQPAVRQHAIGFGGAFEL